MDTGIEDENRTDRRGIDDARIQTQYSWAARETACHNLSGADQQLLLLAVHRRWTEVKFSYYFVFGLPPLKRDCRFFSLELRGGGPRLRH